MTTAVILDIVLIGVLILLNGFFAGAEAALITIRQTHVDELATRRGTAGKILKKLKDAPDRFLATVQVGVTLVGTLAGVISGATIVRALSPQIAQIPWSVTQRYAEHIAIVLVVAIIAFASLVMGELVPKYIALARPGRIALAAARPIDWLAKVGSPLVSVLTFVSRGVTRLLGVHPDETGTPVSDEEIRHLVLEGRTHGSIDPAEHALIHHALDFSDIVTRQIMTPRPDMAVVNLNDDLTTILRTIREEGYSRYPVFDATIDQIKGVLYTKDIIHLIIDRGPIILTDLIRPAMFVPDSMPIAQVLHRFQTEHTHLAIVLDEFGGTAGLVTIEDVLEEIVGEIQDEYDAETDEYRLLEDGTALVQGGMAVIDFNDRFAASLPTDRADTLGGLITAILDRLPKPGDSVELAGFRIEVASREKRRTRLLRVRKLNAGERLSDDGDSSGYA